MAGGEPELGDKVSWNWGGGAPGGKVAEKKSDGKVEIESKRGNKIAKKGEPGNPAVHIERSGNDVVKKASELNVEKKANGGDKKGTKRKASDEADEPHVKNSDGKEVKPGGKDANKKQMKEKDDKKSAEKEEEGRSDKQASGGTEKKKAGRPKGSKGSKKETKSPAPAKEGDMVSTRTRSRGKK